MGIDLEYISGCNEMGINKKTVSFKPEKSLGPWSSLDRTLACGAGGPGFESQRARQASTSLGFDRIPLL